MTQLDDITGLDTARWERARKQAQHIVRDMVAEPDKRLYTGRAFQKYPGWLTSATLVVLALVASAAFWISAGKQIAATNVVLTPIVHDYDRLSTGWADVAIVLSLCLGEFGTVLFSTAAGIFPSQPWTIGRVRVRATEVAFRGASVICACFALLANITITVRHAGSYADIALFGWFMTLAPPIIVLFVGLFAEKLLLGMLEARTAAREAYHQAYDGYETVQRSPESHPDFKRLWHVQILEQLIKVSQANRRKIEAAPELRADLVRREFIRHEWATFEIEGPPSRPTLPSPEGASVMLTSNGSQPQS
jgi:hypothetical protein